MALDFPRSSEILRNYINPLKPRAEMRITVIRCGEVVSESEAAAIDRVKRESQNVGTSPRRSSAS